MEKDFKKLNKVRINDQSILAASSKPSSTQYQFHKNQSEKKKISSNKKAVRIESTYKQLMKDILKRQKGFSRKKNLNISQSQTRMNQTTYGTDKHNKHIQKKNEISFRKARDESLKFLKDFEGQINNAKKN